MEFNEAYEKVLGEFFDDARAALRDGRDWEYKPDDIEFMDATPWYCDDCDRYHLTWYGLGLRVADWGDGWKLYRTLWSCDTDGDWDGSSMAEVGSADAEWIEKSCTWSEVQDAWRNYFQHVLDTGIDELHELRVDEERDRDVPWSFFLRADGDEVYFESASEANSGLWITAPERLPEAVQDYLCLNTERANFWSDGGYDPDVPSSLCADITPAMLDDDKEIRRVGNVFHGRTNIRMKARATEDEIKAAKKDEARRWLMRHDVVPQMPGEALLMGRYEV